MKSLMIYVVLGCVYACFWEWRMRRYVRDIEVYHRHNRDLMEVARTTKWPPYYPVIGALNTALWFPFVFTEIVMVCKHGLKWS